MARYPLAMLAARPPPPAKRGRNYIAAMDLGTPLRFGPPYSGQFAPNIGREPAGVTLFAGVRLWQGAEAWVNPDSIHEASPP
jgi:hypothetical protein